MSEVKEGYMADETPTVTIGPVWEVVEARMWIVRNAKDGRVAISTEDVQEANLAALTLNQPHLSVMPLDYGSVITPND